MDVNDTETLIALVSSLLNGPPPAALVILDTLVKCDGNVEATAQQINSLERALTKPKSSSKKRKSTADLDTWLQPAKAARAEESRVPKPRSRVHEHAAGVASSSKLAEVPRTINARSPSPSKPVSTSKPVVDLMSVLRQPPPAPQAPPKIAPLTLSNPSLVAQHTPCTMHLSVLPPELACRLFYTMVDLSAEWKKNKWWLFDRVVESPHRTSFYARRLNGTDMDDTWQEAAQYWYNGRATEPPAVFPDAMEEACQYVEKVVNDEMRKRERYPLEWNGEGTEGQIWRANVAASNCYEGGKESVRVAIFDYGKSFQAKSSTRDAPGPIICR
ncbi:hypothetical protein HWV62_11922 [Athelia sp. TMB]|nr:hypothetical protein HWV62_11922 [Athelia sp. TMB]